MNAAKPALTPEQRSFLEALFKDDAAFEEDALRVYASDASLRRGPVLAMVRPRTVEQVRELMRWAEVERIPIHPRGRGTSLSGGACPPGRGWLCPCSAWIASLIFPVKILWRSSSRASTRWPFSRPANKRGCFTRPIPPVVRPHPWVVT